jgi:hypothetical protein
MGHYKTHRLRKKMMDEILSEKFWDYAGIDEGYEKLTYLG